MKYLPILLLTLASCSRSTSLRFTNPTDYERKDELITLSRDSLKSKLGDIPPGNFVILEKSGEPIVVQYLDLNGDQSWDELAFLYSFAPNETLELQASFNDEPAAIRMKTRAHARHRRKLPGYGFGPDLIRDSIPAGQPATDFSKQPLPPFLTEGPAWENDKVGFRLYFDVRNGIDIWGKTTVSMVLDDIGIDTADNYHKISAWGMDILKVGQSLGAGALALKLPAANGKDTLVRLGGAGMGPVTYEKIADGPVITIIRLTYPSWTPDPLQQPVKLIHEIRLWGGQFFYESRVTVHNPPNNAQLVTGIVTLHARDTLNEKADQFQALATWGIQSENQDALGMAILTKSADFLSTYAAPAAGAGITNTALVTLPIHKDQPTVFRFIAGWSRSDSRFSNSVKFVKFVNDQGRKWTTPIQL